MTVFSARLRTFALLVAAALAFAIVPAGAAQASGPGSATFTITADGSPVAASTVFLSGPDFRFGGTDESGVVGFTDLALGDYTLQLSDTPQYQGGTFGFSLTVESPHWEQSIALTPWPTGTGSIVGTVVDFASGDPLSGVALFVSRTDAPGPSHNLTTDAAGQFQLTDLVDGLYYISVPFAPGQLSTSTQVEVVGGGSTTIVLPLLAADSTITGRVVDPDGNGVAGLWVGAGLFDGPFIGSTSGQTDAEGYYTLSGAGAGTWEVGVSADTQWERAVLTVEVEAASTATAPDLVLVPRFTGTISGLVGSSDGIPESQDGGFFDVCVIVVEPDGTPVADANTITGGDSFYYFWLAPGDYTVLFEDCDPDREPHGYQSTYLGGSTTLAGATVVTVETNVDVWLDTTVLEPQQSDPEPDHDATPVRTRDLQASDENVIDAPSAVRRGETAEVVVGTEYAGQWVSAWLHPHPTQLGEWHLVSPEGTIEVTVPTNHPLGIHELVVQDADDAVIGWADLRVLQRVR
jgi:hypothetical protein